MQRAALLLSLSTLLFACSSTSAPPGADSGTTPDGSTLSSEAGTSDSGGDSGGAPDCGPLPVIPANPASCPPAYTHADGGCGSPCTVTATCSYPGAGDGISAGCNATAMMWCTLYDAGAPDGGDGGTFASLWVCAQ